MGFWKALFSFGTGIVIAVAATAAIVTNPVATLLGGTALWALLRSDKKEHHVEARSSAAKAHAVADQEIIDTNAALRDLQQKADRDRRLTAADAEIQADLLQKRNESVKARTLATIAEHQAKEHLGQLVPVKITQTSTHVLDGHLGQNLEDQVCGRCGRPMMLQRKREPNPHDPFDGYFLSCTGYFVVHDGQPACKGSVSMRPQNLSLKVDKAQTDFFASNAEVARVLADTTYETTLRRRLLTHVNQSVMSFPCPIHKEGLRLKRKITPGALLQSFYLRCAYCDHTVALKTAGSLSMVLSSFEGRGIIS